MKTYVSDLAPNVEFTSFFLITELPLVRKSKRGKDYLCLTLKDKTGEVDARVWDLKEDIQHQEMKNSLVKVRGTPGEWNDKLQVSIDQIRLVEVDDHVEMGDFFERSERDPEEMWSELRQIVGGMNNPYLRQLTLSVMDDYAEDFKQAPAAKSVHHAFLGGLLEHTLSMCNTALVIWPRYDLDRDLLLAACVFHDIGKLKEMAWGFGTSYTVEGTLLGHISLGMEMVSGAINRIEGFPRPLKVAILHLMASHHGALAWGSPKVPLMKEAVAFHLIDMLDAKMAICDRAIRGKLTDEGLTEWVKELEGPLWKMPRED